ncbi:TLD-domain-containing protein [Aulographum hederae CBS 113979]|uniref:Oxidation resistance protein 1 n=1 Tax=Aulographum hederae CBS 113979 TaxID=1176131 RepID=A0A6G1H514_9PEZI|nr:TLD-domain-containing protein [Aulographum hederae CBS 113979]
MSPDDSSPPPPSSSSTTTTTPFSAFLSYPVQHTVTSLLRRLNSDPTSPSPSSPHATTSSNASNMMDQVYTPPRRYQTPVFQPPPLTPLKLVGYKATTTDSAKLLSRTLAEEIRLLVPPRMQLVENWEVVFSLEEHGVSLSTLYKRAEEYRTRRGGYVLVVKDGNGGTFGAYLSDPPHPTSSYYGTGECFLWRASVLQAIPTLSSLPPPPSADTTHAVRMTTLGGGAKPHKNSTLSPPQSNGVSRSGTSTPEMIRFKAFPYSGVNDYMIFCEGGYLSVGGGDGHYGLWLDDNLDKGISQHCLTFGNEELSDEGRKFEVMGVELWYIGV